MIRAHENKVDSNIVLHSFKCLMNVTGGKCYYLSYLIKRFLV